MDKEQSVKELDSLRQAYQKVFSGPHGELVLKDLARFCGVGKDGFSRDVSEMAHNTGLRKAFLRVQNMMNVTDDHIWRMFNE